MEIISGKSRTNRHEHLLKRNPIKSNVSLRRRLDAPQRRNRCCKALDGRGHDQSNCHMNAYAHCHAENQAQLFGLGMPRQHTVRCLM